MNVSSLKRFNDKNYKNNFFRSALSQKSHQFSYNIYRKIIADQLKYNDIVDTFANLGRRLIYSILDSERSKRMY